MKPIRVACLYEFHKDILPLIINESLIGLTQGSRSCGGAMVYWIEPLTLDRWVAGLIPVNAWHFCPSARNYPHCCSTPKCNEWVPSTLGTLFVALMWHVCPPTI